VDTVGFSNGSPRCLTSCTVSTPLSTFATATFDAVCCVQNGISSFHVDQRALLEVAVKITNPGGLVLFSSYAADFWEHRLEWFRIQSEHGLIGVIDESATTDGTIVCKDGFISTTVAPRQFADFARGLGADVTIDEVDGSSVFCVITAK
jgi:2-polyprenyl-6-hydroxyphenyl methylase/3-demethylubiquinone-9 3-methyltransferase